MSRVLGPCAALGLSRDPTLSELEGTSLAKEFTFIDHLKGNVLGVVVKSSVSGIGWPPLPTCLCLLLLLSSSCSGLNLSLPPCPPL